MFSFFHCSRKKRYGMARMAYVVLIAFFLIGSTWTGVLSTKYFGANSLLNLRHEPFDGLVYPYLYAVDWVKLDGTSRTLAYNQMPTNVKIDPIEYNPSELAIPIESLGFSSGSDLKVRNAKITYSVPYLGTYNLDGVEGAGSHPAVDIVLPKGSPVVAIGNGIVTKVDTQEWGFGKHIVMRHNNFPDFDNPAVTKNYYSSYSHLDEMLVQVGDVVKKGQLIGTIGQTGTATVPHLHFQIDKETAPWFPYWPFTGTEMREAGLDFVSGINKGLGRENGRLHTINPLVYVQKHLKFNNSLVVEADRGEVVRDYEVVAEEQPIVNPAKMPVNYKWDVSSLMILDQEYEVALQSENASGHLIAGETVSNFKFKSGLFSHYSLPSVLDFSKQGVNFKFVPKELGNTNFYFSDGLNDVYSENIEVRLFSDIVNSDKNLRDYKKVRDLNIMRGYADFSFKPDNLVNRAEFAKIVIAGLAQELKDELYLADIKYKDVSVEDWFYEFVALLADTQALDVEREFFDPARPVKLIEFLKVMYIAHKVDVNPTIKDQYLEILPVDEWYSPYVQFALENNHLADFSISDLEKPLTRRDVVRLVKNFW